jgi:hypothetical protein
MAIRKNESIGKRNALIIALIIAHPIIIAERDLDIGMWHFQFHASHFCRYFWEKKKPPQRLPNRFHRKILCVLITLILE